MIPNFDRSSTPVLCIDAVCIVFMAIIIVYAIIFFLRKNEQVVRKTGRICCLHFSVQSSFVQVVITFHSCLVVPFYARFQEHLVLLLLGYFSLSILIPVYAAKRFPILSVKCPGLLFLNLSLSSSVCTFLKFLSGLSPTLMFAAILVKTRKVHKIFTIQLMKNGQR